MSGHKESFSAWFARFDDERKKRKISPGRNVPGFPPPPPGPDEVRRVIWDSINPIGERRAAQLCDVHRTTVSRWLNGTSQIPGPAYAMLLFHAEGIPPGCGEAWRGFMFGTEGLTCPDGKTSYSARFIEGWHYQMALIDVLKSRVRELEHQLTAMTARVDFGAANDSFTQPGDPRARAFE